MNKWILISEKISRAPPYLLTLDPPLVKQPAKPLQFGMGARHVIIAHAHVSSHASIRPSYLFHMVVVAVVLK